MGCNCCNSNELEKLFTFLGISVCFKCKGMGRVDNLLAAGCSCCERDIVTCPECSGNEFLVEEDSILKTLIEDKQNQEQNQNHDPEDGFGLCD